MKNIILAITLLVLFSCDVGASGGDSTFTTIHNNSGSKIEMQFFRNGEFQSVTFIDHNESSEFNLGSGNFGGPTGAQIWPILSADSIWVIYNKASIMHTKNESSPVSRSLLLETSYEGGKTGDKTYEFTYTFTPADYEEALEFGD
jgi:hypothetical protein